MTDNDIIKAKELLKKLEEAYNAYYDTSKNMPYDIDTTIRETAICLEKSIAEINRQKEEIERLQRETKIDESEIKCTRIHRDRARAEAITEFEERLKEKKIPIRLAIGVRDMVEVLFIDQIAKEMKGEQ